MKTPKRDKPATDEPFEDRFNRFAKALMSVPKKELDRETTKDQHEKESIKLRRSKLKQSH
jgi:hypothetical protein